MTQLQTATVKTLLASFGFRVNTQARYVQSVRDFQAGWNLGVERLKIDGDPGPKTCAALLVSEKSRAAGRGTASRHFSFHEFRCKCGGRYTSCRRIAGEGEKESGKYVLRGLLQQLEKLRAEFYPNGLSITSGYRCVAWNRHVGGAKASQHLYGGAVDISAVVDKDKLKTKKWFSGIGYKGSNDKVCHADVRHLTGHNAAHSTQARPAIWRYNF